MFWLELIAFVFVLSFAYAAVKGAPWVPTRARDLERILELLQAKPGEKVYELGCGDGRVSVLVARRTGANVVGVELSLGQYLVAQIRGWFYRATPSSKEGARGSLCFQFGDAFKTDLSDADAVYLFLMPDTYAKIKPKFEKELRPGTRVVSYVWPIPDWTPKKIDTRSGTENVYLYIRT